MNYENSLMCSLNTWRQCMVIFQMQGLRTWYFLLLQLQLTQEKAYGEKLDYVSIISRFAGEKKTRRVIYR